MKFVNVENVFAFQQSKIMHRGVTFNDIRYGRKRSKYFREFQNT